MTLNLPLPCLNWRILPNQPKWKQITKTLTRDKHLNEFQQIMEISVKRGFKRRKQNVHSIIKYFQRKQNCFFKFATNAISTYAIFINVIFTNFDSQNKQILLVFNSFGKPWWLNVHVETKIIQSLRHKIHLFFNWQLANP